MFTLVLYFDNRAHARCVLSCFNETGTEQDLDRRKRTCFFQQHFFQLVLWDPLAVFGI